MKSERNITVPSVRDASKKKELEAVSVINVPTKVQELTSKLQEMKKQRRNVDRGIAKVERELNDIFDAEKIDFMEIENGILCRRRTDRGTEWVIEL